MLLLLLLLLALIVLECKDGVSKFSTCSDLTIIWETGKQAPRSTATTTDGKGPSNRFDYVEYDLISLLLSYSLKSCQSNDFFGSCFPMLGGDELQNIRRSCRR